MSADNPVDNLRLTRSFSRAARHSTSTSSMPDPLEGITLKTIVTELVEAYGWETLAKDIPIRCFTHDPSISSSLHFLRRTPWARTKVENLYRQHRATEGPGDGASPEERAR